MTVTIKPATHGDALMLSQYLRQSDKDEIKASTGRDPQDALVNSFEVSDPELRWTAFLDGKPIVMWGVSDVGRGFGSVWLLASDEIYSIKKEFLAACPEYLRIMHVRYHTLYNWVSTKHEASLNWLDGLGFKVVEFNPKHGVGKEPFLMFAFTKEGRYV